MTDENQDIQPHRGPPGRGRLTTESLLSKKAK